VVFMEKRKKVGSFLWDESGQGMVEYILIIGLIVLFIIVVLIVFRNAIQTFLNKIIGWVTAASPPANP